MYLYTTRKDISERPHTEPKTGQRIIYSNGIEDSKPLPVFIVWVIRAFVILLLAKILRQWI